MKRFYIEGTYTARAGAKKAPRGGTSAQNAVEPFAQAFWAESAAEALRMANEAIAGGQWVEGPRLSDLSEEDRMRQMGAPLLPGFEPPARTARTASKKKA